MITELVTEKRERAEGGGGWGTDAEERKRDAALPVLATRDLALVIDLAELSAPQLQQRHVVRDRQVLNRNVPMILILIFSRQSDERSIERPRRAGPRQQGGISYSPETAQVGHRRSVFLDGDVERLQQVREVRVRVT